MAVEYVQNVEMYNLSGDLPDLVFQTDRDALVFALLHIAQEDTSGKPVETREEILRCSYVTDADGLVTVRDLKSLVEPYLEEELVGRFAYLVGDSFRTGSDGNLSVNGGFVEQFTVQLSRYRLDSIQFIEDYFLTMASEKVTSPGCREYLSAKVSEETLMRAVLLYRDSGSGQLLKESRDLATLSDTSRVLTVDTSSSQFRKEGAELLSYTIVAGNRVFRYKVDRLGVSPAVSFLFLNPFGVKETAYIPGVDLSKGGYEKEEVSIHGERRSYNTTFTRQHEVSTAILPHSLAGWMETLFLSESVFLLGEDGEAGLPVLLSEITDEVSSSSDALHSYKFTWEIARLDPRTHLVKKPARIFDDSFDSSFN